MKCLVLGGGGFLGSHLVDGLLEQGHDVRVFDRPNLRHYRRFSADEAITWLEGDFVDREAMAAAVEGCDAVFHLVSTTLPRSSNENPGYDVETNVVSTINLLDCARRSGVARIVFASSGGTVYGQPRQIPIPETHPTDPLCSYGISKLSIEKYLHLYQELHGLDYRILRFSNPFGERQRISMAQGAVAVFLYKALRREVIEIWGDGSVVRDYFYVGNAVSAMLAALEHRGRGRVFNIGAGQGLSLNELLDRIERILGRDVERRYVAGRAFDVAANVLDTTFARDELGWTIRTSFDDGLVLTCDWMKGLAA